jgi:hypothetical protein
MGVPTFRRGGFPALSSPDLSATTSETAMSAYLNSLQKQITETTRAAPAALRQRLHDWYANLPELTRTRLFAMSEIETALQSQGRHIGPVLLAHGWTRIRVWNSAHPFRRYWQPPSVTSGTAPHLRRETPPI